MKGRLVNKPLRKFATIEGTTLIRVVFPFNPLYIEEIKQIQGRTWNKIKKCWYIPLTLENCFTLRDLVYIIAPELKVWANKAYYKQKEGEITLIIPGLNGVLRPFQNAGVSFVEKNNGKALIADEMGLGKTVQVLAWLQLHPEARPAVVICPATLKLNWENEAKKWLSLASTQILYGAAKPDSRLVGDIIIVNYHIISNTTVILDEIDKTTNLPKVKTLKYSGWIDWLIDYKPKVLVVDESHKMKNNTANWTAPIFKLSRKVPNRIALSGTPIEKGVEDLYNSIKLVDPNMFANRTAFLQRYANTSNGNSFGKKYEGIKNHKELFQKLKTVMIRRKKKDVLTELPDKVYSFIPLELTNKKEYNQASNDFKAYIANKTEQEIRQFMVALLDNKEAEVLEINESKLEAAKKSKVKKATPLTKLEALKQLAVKGKTEELLKWVSDFLESGEKLIIFCEHIAPMDAIEKKFKKISVRIDGSVSQKNRQKAVDDFQTNNKIKLFIGNSAAQEGITLTASSNVGVVEYPWNPGPLAQRIDRAHRMGQKNIVNVYFFCALNTIEETIAKGLLRKQQIADKVLDGHLTETSSLLEDIVNSFKN